MKKKNLKKLIIKYFSLTTLCLSLFFIHSLSATTLKDYFPYEYTSLFTNPVCQTYFYPHAVLANNGELLEHKPSNVYCKNDDSIASASRENSPEHKIIEWIKNPKYQSVFLAYLSFSNDEVKAQLCEEIRNRGLNVTVVLDSGTGRRVADELAKCKATPEGPGRAPEILFRGHSGGNGRGVTGFQHNKIMIFESNDKEVGLIFSSGNLSSGTVLHHENWNFIRTSSDSYFASAHSCLKKGLLDHYEDRTTFRTFIDQCRSEIAAPEESDLQTYFVPGEGSLAEKTIFFQLENSTEVFLAAHRLSWTPFMNTLEELLKNKKIALKIVVDDDLYWSGKLRKQVGLKTTLEAKRLKKLINAGAQVHYMETNQKEFLLHHNKFIVFKKNNELLGVFAGAGNFTGTAFSENFENFYWITIPEVMKSFNQQADHLWDLGTAEEWLPQEMILP